MVRLSLHECHERLGARFTEINGMEVVESFGDPKGEYEALRTAAGILDLSFRGRICLAGADRKRFLHGQVTNEVNNLAIGQGCYAALTTAKGKMQSDLNIYCLGEELLLDFEPGLAAGIAQRFEKYIIADDVQVIDIGAQYGVLSVQGPAAASTIQNSGLFAELPAQSLSFKQTLDPALGEVYCINNPRGQTPAFDLFVPINQLPMVLEKLSGAAPSTGTRLCGWHALEIRRIESGIPRFGADMDETNLPAEAGIESRAISYTKGCYIGQEIIARLRTYGQVAKMLRRLRLADDLKELPQKGDKLFHGEKEAGYITSAIRSPAEANVGLGYVRREFQQVGTALRVHSVAGDSSAMLVG